MRLRGLAGATAAAGLFVAVVAAPGRTAGSADAWEQRGTWFETVLASRQALERSLGARPIAPPLPDLGSDSFTITAWICTTTGGTIVARAPAQGGWAPQGKALFVRDGRLCYDVGWVGAVTGSAAVNDGRWRHVAVVGPSPIRLYVDGKPDGESVIASLPDPAGFVLRAGRCSDNFPTPPGFTGGISDLRIYARPLSSAEIGQAANGATGLTSSGLIGRWSFDASARAIRLDPGQAAPARRADAFAGAQQHDLDDGGPTARRTALWGRVEQAFPDPVSRSEMARERADGIWSAQLSALDLLGLARLYTAATPIPAFAARAAGLAERVQSPGDLAPVRALYHEAHATLEARRALTAANPAGLRRALASIARSTGRKADTEWVDAMERRAQMAEMRLERGELAAAADLRQTAAAFAIRRREALIVQNPLLGSDQLVFVRRKTYQSSHYYTDYIDGCRDYGGGLSVLSLRTGEVRDLVPSLRSGIFGRFDLSWDARHIVFDWKRDARTGFRIYEVGVDGRGLRQITVDPPNEEELRQRYRTIGTPSGLPYGSGTDDMHPCYLPDGGIAFVTTRCQKGILCDGPDVLTTTTLHRMDASGANMRPLSFNSVSEAAPTVTQDGRILYTRWEYVDKGGSACKCLWTMDPDGRMSAEAYANNIANPTTFIDARDVPGSPGTLFAVGAPHMPLGVGSILRINTDHSLRTRLPMENLTPTIETPDEFGYRHLRDGKWVFDTRGPLFCQPFPLSRDFCVVSGNLDEPHNAPAGYGLYLLDAFGNVEPVYRDREYSCWGAVPLRPRPRPASTPRLPRAPVGRAQGTLVLQDVYAGMPGIARGRVRFLRVMEDIPRPWEARRYWEGDANGAMQQHVAVGKDGHLAPKVVHGIVPVEPDGSAVFRVPADRNIFLQALDANGMEIQRMRSFVNVRPGEVRGCVGCHEDRRQPPAAAVRPAALRRSPATPVAAPGERVPRAVDFAADVQPMLTRRCAGCHTGPKAAGSLDLSDQPTELFSRSYEQLIDRALVGRMVNEIGPNGTGKHANIEATDPLTFGSHTSPLIAMLQRGHHGIKLTRPEWWRLVTWIDANSPYYGAWYGRRSLRYRTMPDWRPRPREGVPSPAWPDPDRRPPTTRHSFVCSDNGRGRVCAVSAEGRIEWETPAAFPQDVWRLAGGNILFCQLGSVVEMTGDKRVVWEYRAPAGVEIHGCQPLAGGRVMVVECGTQRIIEVDRGGRIVRSVPLHSTVAAPHMQFRVARKLANGRYLVAFVGERLVREIAADGSIIRTITTPGDVFVAVRLPNGNTLIGCGDGHRVIEVDERDRVVWSIDENELPGHPLRFVAGLQRLRNGNTVVCNWGGHGHVAGQPLVFEVTRDKRVVWQVDDYGLFRTISNIMLTDQPGDPARGELLR